MHMAASEQTAYGPVGGSVGVGSDLNGKLNRQTEGFQPIAFKFMLFSWDEKKNQWVFQDTPSRRPNATGCWRRPASLDGGVPRRVLER